MVDGELPRQAEAEAVLSRSWAASRSSRGGDHCICRAAEACWTPVYRTSLTRSFHARRFRLRSEVRIGNRSIASSPSPRAQNLEVFGVEDRRLARFRRAVPQLSRKGVPDSQPSVAHPAAEQLRWRASYRLQPPNLPRQCSSTSRSVLLPRHGRALVSCCRQLGSDSLSVQTAGGRADQAPETAA
jgi:hypothetical protein